MVCCNNTTRHEQFLFQEKQNKKNAEQKQQNNEAFNTRQCGAAYWHLSGESPFMHSLRLSLSSPDTTHRRRRVSASARCLKCQ
jgi:hypothetical protein